ncbi:hypothetical protein VOLCADRAFT_105838 [Volvox carteri f. nagariensis]|uniref:Uncharacterized protein n=1 Tax=Volvox carteri f. nagariensis TaxID=3068 RepID=D8U3H6_VOLCA|nr:uncharacterized protein VOLCADRAFT_105838 [Volvox carteri f. nagariensis]EFJ45757.1 hypothetical protein VOLCADRAFT_105838 [Volvox carteri f. nagariensis]|eukprot:XP_002953158.1 hypothetical protein VOLCADRAFT_105838 [Volvox carteri f. nagariensis]
MDAAENLEQVSSVHMAAPALAVLQQLRKDLSKQQAQKLLDNHRNFLQLGTCSFGRRGQTSYALRTEAEVQRLCNIANISDENVAHFWSRGVGLRLRAADAHAHHAKTYRLLRRPSDSPSPLEASVPSAHRLGRLRRAFAERAVGLFGRRVSQAARPHRRPVGATSSGVANRRRPRSLHAIRGAETAAVFQHACHSCCKLAPVLFHLGTIALRPSFTTRRDVSCARAVAVLLFFFFWLWFLCF